LSLSKNQYEDSDDDEDMDFIPKKGLKTGRRFALRVLNVNFEGDMEKLRKNDKLE